MNAAQSHTERLLTLAGICKITGADYRDVMKALRAAGVQPTMMIDDRQLFGPEALATIRRHLPNVGRRDYQADNPL